MNFSRLNDCCDALRDNPGPESFTTSVFHNPCGTPACVLGHYETYILKDHLFSSNLSTSYTVRAAEHFDVSFKESLELFGAWGCGGAKTAQQAIAYIEDFIIRHGGEVRVAASLIG